MPDTPLNPSPGRPWLTGAPATIPHPTADVPQQQRTGHDPRPALPAPRGDPISASKLSGGVVGWWWSCAFLFYGLGDLYTTTLGLRLGVVSEGGPVVARSVALSGLWVLVPLKLLVFAVAYLLWRVVPRPHHVAVPLALFVLGVVVTAWNTITLLSTV